MSSDQLYSIIMHIRGEFDKYLAYKYDNIRFEIHQTPNITRVETSKIISKHEHFSSNFPGSVCLQHLQQRSRFRPGWGSLRHGLSRCGSPCLFGTRIYERVPCTCTWYWKIKSDAILFCISGPTLHVQNLTLLDTCTLPAWRGIHLV